MAFFSTEVLSVAVLCMFPPTNRIDKLELCLYELGIAMNGFEALLVYPVVRKTAIYLTWMSYFIF